MNDWPAGTQRFVYETIDSTMAEAHRKAATVAGAAWFLSHEQTAGTGRRGRAWDSQNGNFAASLLIRPGVDPAQLALRSFAASLALRDTFVALTGREDIIALKWPNDVLMRGAKIAGILLETHHEGADHPALIIGIGVNLMSNPDTQKIEDTALTPTSLKREVGLQISPEDFLETLAPAYDRWEQQLATYGFAPLRTAWLAAAANVGKTITARMVHTSLTGTFKTVDDSGALILQAADGQHTITAAEISF